MSGPLFITAMRSEALAVRLGAPRSSVLVIGMGGKRARAARPEIERRLEGRLPVLLGVSGGLDPTLRPGDIVVASSLIGVDDDEQFPLPQAAAAAAALEGSGITVRTAPIATTPRIVSGREAREKIAATGAVAVDLESCWLAPLAVTGLLVIRVVLDVPGRDLFSMSTVPAALSAARALARVSRQMWRSGMQVQSDLPTEFAKPGDL